MSGFRRAFIGSLAPAMGASFVAASRESGNDRSQTPPTTAAPPTAARTTRKTGPPSTNGSLAATMTMIPNDGSAGPDIAGTRWLLPSWAPVPRTRCVWLETVVDEAEVAD
jgi:hypothetical protein